MPSSLRRGLLAGAVILVAGALAAVTVSRMSARRPSPAPALQTRADPEIYALAFPDADGKPQAIAQWKGKRLVLNFWATWCTPCVAEMPELEKAQARLPDVVIVGLGTEDPARVRQFRDKVGLHLTLLAGGYEALTLARTLGDTQGVLPYTVLLSADGQVMQAQSGPLRDGQLQQWLAQSP